VVDAVEAACERQRVRLARDATSSAPASPGPRCGDRVEVVRRNTGRRRSPSQRRDHRLQVRRLATSGRRRERGRARPTLLGCVASSRGARTMPTPVSSHDVRCASTSGSEGRASPPRRSGRRRIPAPDAPGRTGLARTAAARPTCRPTSRKASTTRRRARRAASPATGPRSRAAVPPERRPGQDLGLVGDVRTPAQPSRTVLVHGGQVVAVSLVGELVGYPSRSTLGSNISARKAYASFALGSWTTSTTIIGAHRLGVAGSTRPDGAGRAGERLLRRPRADAVGGNAHQRRRVRYRRRAGAAPVRRRTVVRRGRPSPHCPLWTLRPEGDLRPMTRAPSRSAPRTLAPTASVATSNDRRREPGDRIQRTERSRDAERVGHRAAVTSPPQAGERPRTSPATIASSSPASRRVARHAAMAAQQLTGPRASIVARWRPSDGIVDPTSAAVTAATRCDGKDGTGIQLLDRGGGRHRRSHYPQCAVRSMDVASLADLEARAARIARHRLDDHPPVMLRRRRSRRPPVRYLNQ